MKLPFLIFFLFLTVAVSGQQFRDTCFTRAEYNDWKRKFYELYDQKESSLRQVRLLKNLRKIDTSFQSKDSLIITYLDKNDLTIKSEKQIYRHNCMTDSVVTHFNLKGLIAYSEWWRITCDNPDTLDNEVVIYKYKSSYYRFEYDKEDRVTKQVIHISTPYTRIILYSYDSKGNATTTVKRINEDDFWD